MELIETVELASSAANITFSSIPADYDDLLLLMSCRSDQSGAFDNSNTKINGSAGTITRLTGDGSSAASSTGAAFTLQWPASSSTSNTFGNTSFYISDYTASSKAKSVSIDISTENNATSASLQLMAGLTTTTSAVTTIEVDAPGGSGNFVTGSIISLYGISNAL